MDDEFVPTLTHATERDVDLLLVEELTASRPFVAWVVERAGWTGAFSAWSVLHSKRRIRNRREIDIHLELIPVAGNKPVVVLIENKLDAEEQPDQGLSYGEELAVISPDAGHAASLLVCPENYATAHAEFAGQFSAVVTYEEIAAFLRAAGSDDDPEGGRRKAFRASLLDQAIHKHRRGYTPVLNDAIGSFNKRYVELLRELAPEITPGPTMLKAANPDESVSMIFDSQATFADLPVEIRPRRFAHELGRGKTHRANYVAVTFAKWGARLEDVKAVLLNDIIDENFSLHAGRKTKGRPNPGLVLSTPTAPADNQADFDEQKPLLAEGILTAKRLRNWLMRNQVLLFKWRDLIEAN